MANLETVQDSALTWMLLNGSARLDASELDDQMLEPFDRNAPPSGPSDVTELFAINQTDIVIWVMNGQPFSEPQSPIVYGNASDGWNAATTLHMPGNATIDLIMYVANDSMDTVGCVLFSRMPRRAAADPRLDRWGIPCTFMATNSGFWDQVQACFRTVPSWMHLHP